MVEFASESFPDRGEFIELLSSSFVLLFGPFAFVLPFVSWLLGTIEVKSSSCELRSPSPGWEDISRSSSNDSSNDGGQFPNPSLSGSVLVIFDERIKLRNITVSFVDGNRIVHLKIIVKTVKIYES